MRSFASVLVVVSFGAVAAIVVRAETPSPRTIYTDALLRERSLRQQIETSRSETPPPALLERMRSLVETYERMSRQFPTSAYMDNALLQAALLSAARHISGGEDQEFFNLARRQMHDGFPTGLR